MTENQISNNAKFETFRDARLATAICVTVIVDDSSGSVLPQAVCRFFLTNGTFIGEIPAQNIIAADKNPQATF